MRPKIIILDKIGSPEFGYLSVGEAGKNIPFPIKRVYWTYSTPEKAKRGMHAHKELEQVVFALHGTLRLNLDNGKGDQLSFELNHPNEGLYIPKLWWREIFFSGDAVLLSLASMEYQDSDYYRDYTEFKRSVS